MVHATPVVKTFDQLYEEAIAKNGGKVPEVGPIAVVQEIDEKIEEFKTRTTQILDSCARLAPNFFGPSLKDASDYIDFFSAERESQ